MKLRDTYEAKLQQIEALEQKKGQLRKIEISTSLGKAIGTIELNGISFPSKHSNNKNALGKEKGNVSTRVMLTQEKKRWKLTMYGMGTKQYSEEDFEIALDTAAKWSLKSPCQKMEFKYEQEAQEHQQTSGRHCPGILWMPADGEYGEAIYLSPRRDNDVFISRFALPPIKKMAGVSFYEMGQLTSCCNTNLNIEMVYPGKNSLQNRVVYQTIHAHALDKSKSELLKIIMEPHPKVVEAIRLSEDAVFKGYLEIQPVKTDERGYLLKQTQQSYLLFQQKDKYVLCPTGWFSKETKRPVSGNQIRDYAKAYPESHVAEKDKRKAVSSWKELQASISILAYPQKTREVLDLE
jgi:hypothetical protein